MKSIALSGNSSWSILNFRKNLIIRLIKEGYDVHIIAPSDSSSKALVSMGCSFHNIKMQRLGLNPFKDIFLVLNYYRLLSQLKIDYVCSFNVKPNLYISFACYFLKTKQIMNISGLGSAFLQGGLISFVVKTLYKIALFQSRIVFFQNHDDLKLFRDYKIYSANKENVLPGSGIDLKTFPLNNNHLLHAGVGKKIVFIGRLIKDKGIREFLQSAKEVSSRHKEVDFYIYGEVDKNNPSSLTVNERDSVIHPRIHFLGKVENIKNALKDSHCVVLPSYREGMSRSLLEAAATGIPVIATNVPGCKEIVDHNVNGFLCEASNSKDLTHKIENFLSLSPIKMKNMGDAGRLKIEKEFSVEIVINQYICKLKQSYKN